MFNFSPTRFYTFSFSEALALFFQQTTVYCASILFVTFLITILLVRTNVSSLRFGVLFNLVKYTNMSIVSFIFLLVFLKFSIYLWGFRNYGYFLSNIEWRVMGFNLIWTNCQISLNTSLLSDVIILLAFSSGLICLYLLGEKNISKYVSNLSIFSIFLVAIIFMVYTTNLLVMFVGFEFLFLPTLYFVYSHGYVQRTDKTIKVLLYWTLFGAFLVFTSMGYLYIKYKTLNCFVLATLQFSELENTLIYLSLFVGFGVKVPVFPFHYWLTKIHVEAPAGFSIFLSGFLVKAAIYCFYYFNLIFQAEGLVQLATSVALLGVIESSIKMWTQTDFKKLIAFATIQEMNLILYLLLNYQNVLDYSLVLFILIHGWLSTLMFFLVEIIQKKTGSRNIVDICGLAYTFPEIKLIIWFIVLLFSGFPLTVKFLIEWEILGCLILQSNILFLGVFFIIVVFGVTGFTKQMIIILYGTANQSIVVNHTIAKRDKYLFYLIVDILVVLNIINFILG